MAEQPDYVDVTFYATVVPEFARAVDEAGRPILRGGKLDKTTQRPPTYFGPEGGVVTKVTLRIDADVLLPLLPSTVIAIHAGQVETVHAKAENPGDLGLDQDETPEG